LLLLPLLQLWLGTHPNGPTTLSPSTPTSLNLLSLLNSNPAFHLGSTSSLSDLPYLLKILSIHKVLSIQSHPDSELAVKLNASNPTVYKTPCHKPEMAIALTEFRAMLGFRPISELHSNLQTYPELKSIVGQETVDKVKRAYERTKGCADFDVGVKGAVKYMFSEYMRNFSTRGSGEGRRSEATAACLQTAAARAISICNSIMPIGTLRLVATLHCTLNLF